MRMPFGKHRGKEIGELPQDYLEWLVTISYGGVFREVCNVPSLSDCGPRDSIDDSTRRSPGPNEGPAQTYPVDRRKVVYDDFGPVGFGSDNDDYDRYDE